MSPDVESFRSPVHKGLFKARRDAFDAFKATFHRQACDSLALLRKLKSAENTLHAAWGGMIQQILQHSSIA